LDRLPPGHPDAAHGGEPLGEHRRAFPRDRLHRRGARRGDHMRLPQGEGRAQRDLERLVALRRPLGVVDRDRDDAPVTGLGEDPRDVRAGQPQLARHFRLRTLLLVVQACRAHDDGGVTRGWHGAPGRGPAGHGPVSGRMCPGYAGDDRMVPESGVTDPGGPMSTDPRPADGAPRAPLALTVVLAHLDVVDAEDVLRSPAGRLLDAGAVTLDFPDALRQRERTYPTGLPTPIPTAIPHADPQHVVLPSLALATLARPVPFGEMGADGGSVDVRLVAMPLLTDAREHLAALQRLMGLRRDETVVAELLAQRDDDALRE